MAFQNLNLIRKHFTPRLTHRWDIKFNAEGLQLISDWFPAESVSYDRYSINSESITIAPGLSIELNTHADKKSSIDVRFYETSKKSVLKFMEAYLMKAGLNNALNGLPGEKDQLIMDITEYNTKGEVDSRSQYIVEPSGQYTETLTQDASVYTGDMKFNILGINYENLY